MGGFFDFNPHLRMGGDDVQRVVNQLLQNFNPHLRMGGDLDGQTAYVTLVDNFNPHLRMGGDIIRGRMRNED